MGSRVSSQAASNYHSLASRRGVLQAANAATKDFISANPRIISDARRGPNEWVVMSSGSTGRREFIVATGLALMLAVLLSFIAAYGLNRYWGSTDEIQTTGSLRQSFTN
jgi:hypothetical protein